MPLFYFVTHFFAAHMVAVVLAWIRYGTAALAFTFYPVPSMGGPRDLFPPAFGYDLWVTYLVWALLVVALYPACRWFARSRRGATTGGCGMSRLPSCERWRSDSGDDG